MSIDNPDKLVLVDYGPARSNWRPVLQFHLQYLQLWEAGNKVELEWVLEVGRFC